MKKIFTGIALVTALLSTSALASKARLIALGENQDGSYLVEDIRSIFFNPAHIMHHGSFVTFEYGDKGANASTKTDKDDNPHGEGGFVTASGNSAYGVFLGRESNKTAELRFTGLVAATTSGTFSSGTPTSGGAAIAASSYYHADNVVNFYYGKSTGAMDWGASLSVSQSSDDNAVTINGVGFKDREQSNITASWGMVKGDQEVYLGASLTGSMESTATTGLAGKYEYDGKMGVKAGYLKKMPGNAKFNATVTQISFDGITPQNTISVELREIDINYGKMKKINDKVNLWTSVSLNYDTLEVEDANTTILANIGRGEEETSITIPVTVAIEAKVKEWLTLRGSVSQNIYGEIDKDDKKSSITDSTNINAGATLVFGDLSFDGLIGTGYDGTDITDSDSEQGVLSTDNLMTRVSMTYKF